MFSLIITIISIALVAALAVATVYYGGNQFNQGNSKAAASAITTAAQQIAAANTLIYNDQGSYVVPGSVNVSATCGTTAGCFPSTYLKSIPKAPTPAIATTSTGFAIAANNVVTLAVDGSGKTDVCEAINKNSGITTMPTDETAFNALGVSSGCYANGTNFVFKYLG